MNSAYTTRYGLRCKCTSGTTTQLLLEAQKMEVSERLGCHLKQTVTHFSLHI